MREIKFRARHKESGKWRTFELQDLVNGHIPEENYMWGNWSEYVDCNDKNNKEIFDGDYLKHNDKIWEVRWSHGGFYLVNPKNQLEASSFHDIDFRQEKNPDGFEVVGNIYDNPELLKGGE